MAKAIVALGSNLGERERRIDQAVDGMISELGACVARSALLETEAWIHPDDDADWHPPFLNAVAIFETRLEPLEILERLLTIERSLGRRRDPDTKPWQPRPIDLDLIAVDDSVIEVDGLILPHPRMQDRRFVLEPLASILPDWRHPILNKTVTEMLNDLAA